MVYILITLKVGSYYLMAFIMNPPNKVCNFFPAIAALLDNADIYIHPTHLLQTSLPEIQTTLFRNHTSEVLLLFV